MKKTILTLIMIGIISTSSLYAQEIENKTDNVVKYSFEEARKTALQNSEELKIKDKIIESISKKKDIQVKDYYQNNPDYEYNGIQKTEVYNHSYKTYDYTKILENEEESRKNIVIANEKKTLNIFSNIINYKNEIKNKQMQVEDKTNEYKQSEIKFKTGMITKTTHNLAKNSLENATIELKNLETKLEFEEKKFKEHLGIDMNSKISLELAEQEIDVITPQLALATAEKNKKTMLDLQKDLKELNDDMSWIKLVSTGYEKEQEKLIEEKQKDINELKKNSLHSYDTQYNNILIKANELSLDKINKMQLDIKKTQIEALYKQGYEKSTSLDKINMQIEENLLSQIKKQLEIKWLIMDYESSII